MELKQAILERRSIRGFKEDPVAKETIEDILRVATRAVSANNTQPWEFAVITGDVMKKIGADNVARLNAGEEMDNGEEPFSGVYRTRQVGIGKALLGAMEIAREDRERRNWWGERGFRFFDAPCAIIIYVDDSLNYSDARLDVGCVIQNICMYAMEHGLGTCVENQAVMYEKGLRQYLDVPENKKYVTGIAIGYPDPDFPANSVISTRDPIEENTRWYGFEE